MRKKKITNNFYYYEVERKGFPKVPTKMEVFLLQYLFGNLQVIREVAKRSFRISDCRRTITKYESMLLRGYYPSETSDHFWGQKIKTRSAKKKKRYGPVYECSMGAIDFVPAFKCFEVFELAVRYNKAGMVDFGQIIYEKNPKTGAEWIHISNSPSLLYTKFVIDSFSLKRGKYMITKNGGKTYRIYKP